MLLLLLLTEETCPCSRLSLVCLPERAKPAGRACGVGGPKCPERFGLIRWLAECPATKQAATSRLGLLLLLLWLPERAETGRLLLLLRLLLLRLLTKRVASTE